MMEKMLSELKDEDLRLLLSRDVGISDVLPAVNDIIMEIGEKGDEALFKYTEKFEGARLDDLRVSDEEIEVAYDLAEDRLLEALSQAADNILQFHSQQRERDLWLTEIAPGVSVGQKVVPLDSVGAYVPGGRASYPSSALMNIIPARVAGVSRIAVCTPPKADGSITPLTLAAADMAGADEIYKLGGAQAIAAMGLGTESIERVQKIVGPGNVYVTAAKMLMRGSVEIDFPAGPSEVLILADRTADPGVIAADMIAQGEHDPKSISVLVALDDLLASAVVEELKIQAASAARMDIVQQSLDHSAVLLAADLDEALDFCNAFAPEHLEIITADPMEALRAIRHAGSVFLGRYTPVAAGDYASGTNHVLPTSGYARAFSGLNVDHFTKKISVQMITDEGLLGLEETITALAEAEGLRAHAESVRRRLESKA
ncbi:MAG TPA: histidinol dehydrogenase [Methanothrix sp.]|nr:histidinol dehydrogenase [Methanothrix sp.]HPC90500.1 histidinol dehydrogenase [Methanothrix sp.]HQE88322.1 histidinol dehydrogenase [Methanothrix sp.]HQI68901.1 histidinol dehydrogenase [Methanothrix sp.]HRS85902.1 histidinol dehydrogenase [Methanothrix sp.]